MIPKLNIFLALLAVCLLLAGCGGLQQREPQIEYYNLEYASPPVPHLQARLPVRLRVDNFSASPILQTNQIVYRDKQYRSNLYFYHRWRVQPAQLVTYFLSRDLQQSGLFQAVSSPFAKLPHTHLLEGAVEKFMEWDEQGGWQAVIVLRVAFIDAQESALDKRVLFQEKFSAKNPCAAKSPQEVAAAMSEAMADISAQITTHIYQTFVAQEQQ